MSNLARFIKSKSTGEKVPRVTTSLNLEARHLEFLKARNLNLSAMVREYIDRLIDEESKTGTENL